MDLNICNICGANYEYKDGMWRCPACGAYKPQEISNEEETLLYAAAQKLRLSAFDEAEELYRDIVSKYPKNSRGYWGLVLAQYGIKYETDYDGKMIPSCYAASYKSILGDENYKKALQYSDKDNRAYYEEQAKKIEAVRCEWIEKAEREKPYDIFISYKDSDRQNGIERTQDSYDAYELYNKLKEKGYRVFFGRESLVGKEGEKYEPYIFNALNTAQVMIVYATKPEYVEATWVKNEWMRYYKRIKAGQKQEGSLLLVYRGLDPSKLPKPLCDIQGIDLGRITIGFGDLEIRIENILGSARMHQKLKRVTVKNRTKRSAEQIRRLNTVTIEKVTVSAPQKERASIVKRSIGGKNTKLSASAEKILAVAEGYLSRERFADAEERFDDILRNSPRDGRALIGKFLASLKAHDMSDLEQNGLRIVPDAALVEKVLFNADKESAEKILSVLCIDASKSFDNGDVPRAKFIVSVVRDCAGVSADRLRDELYERGLHLIPVDEESAKYFLDIHLSFSDDADYVEKLHSIVDAGIGYSSFSIAEYYAIKLMDSDPDSYATQLALLKIEYKTNSGIGVLRCIDREKAYRKIDELISGADAKSAAEWLRLSFSWIVELLQRGVYYSALHWIEICAKYRFDGRTAQLESLLSICLSNASSRSAECFETILTYIADGDPAVYAEKAKTFADAALTAKEYAAAKLYYEKALSVRPDYVAAARGRFFADICCASDADLPAALVDLTDWACFEEVLEVQADDTEDMRWIEKLSDACLKHIRKEGQNSDQRIFTVFEKFLSYVPEKFENELIASLKRAAGLCLDKGLFAQAQKYYEMQISENAEDSAAYWGLLQSKLKCRNDNELICSPQPIIKFVEFENAQICAANDKKLLDHYIDIGERQGRHIGIAQRRKKIFKIGIIIFVAAFLVAAALSIWFAYYGSQNRLLYVMAATNDGYGVSAGKFYKAESILTIPSEINGQPVVAIDDGAFAGHDEIEELILPSSIEIIGADAFANCENLRTVTFKSNGLLRTLDFQTALCEIGDGAFSGCGKLDAFDFPYGVEHIGAYAFAETAIDEAVIPATVNYIGNSAFNGCDALRTIIVGDRERIPYEWAENWDGGCNAVVEFRLRVAFDYNNATANNDISEKYIVFGDEFTFPAPKRNGYSFDGWFRDDVRLTDDTGRSVSAWSFTDGGIVSAGWIPNVNEIVFNANGGTGYMQGQRISTDESDAFGKHVYSQGLYFYRLGGKRGG